MHIDVVTVPYRYDRHLDGSGRGPNALLEAGLIARLRASGVDAGDPRESLLPDNERTGDAIAVNIGRLGAHTASHVASSLTDGSGVLVLSGDDTATVGVVAGVQEALGAGVRLGLLWLDAHGDFNTPDTSYSGILAGMPVAILAGLAGPLWRGAAGLAAPIPTDRIAIAGVRSLDERERTLIKSTDVRVLSAKDVRNESAFATAVERLANASDVLCIHVDIDVLDPSLVPSSATPEPRGLVIAELTSLVRTALATGKVAVVSLAGVNPGAGALGRTSVQTALNVLLDTVPSWSQDERGDESDASA